MKISVHYEWHTKIQKVGSASLSREAINPVGYCFLLFDFNPDSFFSPCVDIPNCQHG